jgi:hypothetical protein
MDWGGKTWERGVALKLQRNRDSDPRPTRTPPQPSPAQAVLRHLGKQAQTERQGGRVTTLNNPSGYATSMSDELPAPSEQQLDKLSDVLAALRVPGNIDTVQDFLSTVGNNPLFDPADLEWLASDREQALLETRRLMDLLTAAGQDIVLIHFAGFRLLGQGRALPVSGLNRSSAPATTPACDGGTLSGQKRGRTSEIEDFFRRTATYTPKLQARKRRDS